ncbi:hypothetical protein J6590_049812 [Homalodisca vitripennis]|nr:hypothetical protein J6590_049812 [Homalodisca vitripennis]
MFKPLSWLFRLSGILPQHNKSDKYVTATTLSLILLSMVHSIPYWYKGAPSSLKEKILFASFIMSMVSTIFHIIQAYYRRQFFKTVTSRLASLGRRLLVKTPKYLNFEVALFFMYSLMTTARTITMQLEMNDALASTMRAITYSFSLAPLMQQLMLMYQLDCCFYELNNQLQVIVKKSQNTSLGMLRADLRAMFIAHVDLRQFIADLNSYFALVNLLSILSRLFITICTMYSILISISDNNGHTLVYTSQVITSFAIVVATAELGYRCSEKGVLGPIFHMLLTNDFPKFVEDFYNTLRQL